MMSPAYESATRSAPTATTVDAWLQWFATAKQAACRSYLCTRYQLNALDAEALINAALLQVFRHWATLDNPLAYVWQTLTHAVAKQGQRRTREQQQLAVFTQQHRLQAHGAARTAEHVAAVLEQVFPSQLSLLEWFIQGYDDSQMAAWLKITPAAVRVKRHRLIRTLQTRLCPSGGCRPRRPGGEEFF